MPRNLVLCCDGTSNKFGTTNTNVVRLVQVLDRDPSRQRLYYDPGVGTLPQPTWSGWAHAWWRKLKELGFGAGLSANVLEAYTYLMSYWEPGDRVFLFGFSRGAYTVRVLAGMLHVLGLLPRGGHNHAPYAMELFKSIRGQEESQDGKYWKLCEEFRWTFARQVDGRDDRRFPVHFLGVWDTVSSVGWVWDPARFPYTARNPSIQILRHAVAIDERRWFFRQNLMRHTGGQDFQELWFAGSHGDVGGGYPDSAGGLWQVAFGWMLDEARRAGLAIDNCRLAKVLGRSPVPGDPCLEPCHDSLTWQWWPAEFWPKRSWRSATRRAGLRVGMGRPRRIPAGAALHGSVLRRVRERKDYRPRNFSPALVKQILTLGDVPPMMRFTADKRVDSED